MVIWFIIYSFLITILIKVIWEKKEILNIICFVVRIIGNVYKPYIIITELINWICIFIFQLCFWFRNIILNIEIILKDIRKYNI